MENRISSDKLAIAAEQKVKERDYWLNKLSGDLIKSVFPYDYIKENANPVIMKVEKFEFPETLFSISMKLSKGVDVKLHMILVTGLVLLLNKYTHNRDILIGSPILKQEIEGEFVNTVLVFRNDVEDNISFKELLLQVRNTIIKANENQNYPIEILLDELNIPVVENEFPLFDTVILFENLHDKRYIQGINYNMMFSFLRTDGGIEGIVEYNSLLYRQCTIKRIINYYMYVLGQGLLDVNLEIARIELLSGEERKQVLFDFNSTVVDYPTEKPLHRLFEEQAEKRPGGVAVIGVEPMDHVSITSGELNRQSDQLAHVLKEMGVGPDTIVSIMVERSLEMIIGILGILKSGAAYLPIEPDYPVERIEYMLADSGAKILVNTRILAEYGEKLRSWEGKKIFLEDILEKPESSSQPLNLSTSQILSPANLAYVLYTSGTTGKPKGVMVEHRNVTAYLHAFYQEFKVKPEDTIMQLASYAFDVFVEEVFPILLRGGKIVIPGNSEVMDMDLLAQLIVKHHVNIIDCTPLLLNEFNKLCTANPIDNPLRSVHKFISGGDILKGEYVDSLLNNGNVYNTYGPTETTVCVTYYHYTYENETNQPKIPANIPIGKPISNYNVYILDESNKPVPPGVTGELCVAGDGVTRGYLSRIELTGEKFVENPFISGGRIYKTGDIGRWLPDGNIEFAGRKDNQVKIRGYRIETGEIENRLLKNNEIEECVVMAREDNNGIKYLCAYIVSKKGFDASELKESLALELPDYMIPSFFVPIDQIPLNPNGKIDKKALPEPEVITGLTYVAPQNPAQEQMQKIWHKVLGLESIGIYDNFFSIGGNSLRGIQVINDVHKEFNVKVPLAEMFRSATIKGLSEYIAGAAEDKFVSIDAAEEKEYYVLSSAQKRLYILRQMKPESIAYNMPQVIPLAGVIQKKALQQTLIKLMERHESLRTSFVTINEQPVQRIYRVCELEFGIECYETVNERVEVEKIIKNFVKPFNLAQAPLLRVALVKTNDEKYILIMDMHHIVSDEVSHAVLASDIMSLFLGRALTPLPIQYKDFAEWQNKEKERKNLEQQGLYWLKEFSAELPVLNLPTDYPRPLMQSFEGSSVDLVFNEKETQKLTDIAKETDATVYMVLLSVYTIFISKLSGQEDIIIGTPIAARRYPDLENIVGMFVNTLALRNYPSGDKTYKDFLIEIKERTLEAFENQEYPFEDLVEKLAVNRDASRNPVFDVMFTFQNFEPNPPDNPVPGEERPGSEKEISDLIEAQYEYETTTSKFDMTLHSLELEKILSFIVEYSTKLFKKETIERLITYFKKVTADITKNVEIKLADIEIISEKERNRILFDFNNTSAGYPLNKTIHQLFEQQAARTPGHTAVKGAESIEQLQITYYKLNEKSNRLAHLLREKCVGPDTIVGIMVERSLEMIIGILGILKSGAAYLPIEPDYPAERIKFMLADSNTAFLLAAPAAQVKVEAEVKEEKESIEIIDISERFPSSTSTLTSSKVSSVNLAYILYTSGTTGRPKGVMIEHRHVVRLLFNDKFQFDFNHYDVWTMFHSYCFDFSVWEMYGALLYGGKLIVIPRMTARDPSGFLEILIKECVTVLNQVPTAFYNLAEEELRNGQKALKLKYVIFGGEALKPGRLRNWKSRYPGTMLINMYGITETTVHVTYKEIENKDIEVNISAIGGPIPTTHMYGMDKNQKLVPIGVVGELSVGGEGVGRGYLNQPGLTAEKFVTTPYIAGERLYRSGDLVRWLPDGNMEFLGRIDHQVKIRGHRIELGEIECQLLNRDEITEAVVLAKEDEKGNNYLCAYIVSDKEFSVTRLRSDLCRNLPDYMLPSWFIPLEKIPLTANGKIDVRSLPAPELKVAADSITPGDDIEEKLAEIWSEILGIEKRSIGIDANFFELGGHSLKATVLSARIHKEFHVKVPLAEVFKTPHIRGLSESIKGLKEDRYSSIEPVEAREYYELSSAQERLYILQQMELDSLAYNIPEFLPLAETPGIEKLEESFRKLINRHESLRTSFHLVAHEPVQRIHEDVEFEIESYDLATESTESTEKLPTDFVRPFDLSQAPLLKVGILKTNEEKYILMVDMHHIVSDGVSHEILVTDFMAFLEGETLPPLRIQYKDYSRWQNSEKETEKLKQQEVYWLDQFRDEVPVLDLPLDLTRPAVQRFEGKSIGFEMGSDETDALKKVAVEGRATLFMVLLAVCNILFSKLSSQQDIIVGTPVAGRRNPDMQKMIGMFVNTLAIRNEPKGEISFSEFLRDLRWRTLQALENQEYPFEDLVEKVSVHRDVSRNPLFDVMFVLQNFDTYQEQTRVREIAGKKVEERTTAKFDLTLAAVEPGSGLILTFNYNTSLFRQQTIETFIAYFKKIIARVITNPEIKISDIEIISEEEKDRILYDFNHTERAFPGDKTLYELFAEQAERTPDHVAIIGKMPGEEEPHAVTYRELNKCADQLAHLLQWKGVGPDTIVGIRVEPSVEMIIGIMGILKAGGAYLPIDPQYPQKRIDYILADSNAAFLLAAAAAQVKEESIEIIDISEGFSSSTLTLTSTLSKVSPANFAYLIYTSGTTGRPKGVLVTHQGAVNTLTCRKEEYKIDANAAALQLFSYVFDGFVTALFTPVISGAKVILPHGRALKDIATLKEIIVKYGITHFISVPVLYAAILETLTSEETASLKLVTLAGDRVMPELLEKTKAVNRNLEISIEYGVTEASVMSTISRHQEIEEHLTIGYPAWNTQIYILDKNQKLQPPGLPGELCVSGVGLAHGYLNNPELTAEKFFSVFYRSNRSYRTYSSEKVYKTGDLARWLADGNIEFLGRIDHQVKIRGYRIEPGEIENRVLAYPGIKRAVVIDWKSSEGEKYLCAYIVPQTPSSSDLPGLTRPISIRPAELEAFLSQSLPDYMIPSYFVQVEEIPLTPNGKIDRKALSAPGWQQAEYIAPRNDLEKKLVEIWSDVLLIEKETIGIHDNFFRLGGHSLKATIVMSRINREFGVRVPLVEVFKTPTIRKLTEYIYSAKGDFPVIKDDQLVLLKKARRKAEPFFFIHDGSGEVEAYIELCNRLNGEFDFWGIQAEKLENYTPHNLFIEEMAQQYIKKIKTVQARGPYRIGGWSIGGTIGFEMVRRLEEQKEEIEFLALIDTMPPDEDLSARGMEFNLASELELIQRYFPGNTITKRLEGIEAFQQVWPAVLAYLEEGEFKFDVNNVRKVSRTGPRKDIMPFDFFQTVPNSDRMSIREFIAYLNTVRTFDNARNKYIPGGKIDTTVHFFKAGEPGTIDAEKWNVYCKKPIITYTIPGDHYSIFKVPGVAELARQFDVWLISLKNNRNKRRVK